MGEFDVRGSDLKKLIKLARKEPVAFAFNPGGGPKHDYFGMDRRKSPKVVGKKALDEGVGKKAAFGTATVEGDVILLTCQREVPAIAKKLKKYLKTEKVSLNVQILGVDGSILESDIEDDLPDDPNLVNQAAGDSAPQTPEYGPESEPEEQDLTELRARLKEVGGRIQGVEAGAAKILLKHYKQLVEFLKAGDSDRLEAGIGKVSDIIDKLTAVPNKTEDASQSNNLQDADSAKWDALKPKVEAVLQQAVSAAPTAAAKLEAAWAKVVALGDADQFDKAIAAAGKLVPVLQKLVAQPQQTTQKARVQEAQEDETGSGDSGNSSQDFEAAKQELDRLLAAMAKALDEARRVLPDRASGIGKLSGIISGLSNPKELAAARKAANNLQIIADDGAERASLIAAALEEVELVRRYIDSVGQEFEESLGSTPPEKLRMPLKTAKDSLSGAMEVDPDKIEQSIDEAMSLLEKSEKDIDELLADKAGWEAQLGLFDPRVTALENHNKKDEEAVRVKIKAVADGLVAARKLAAQHKYQEATAALPPLAKICSEGEKYADACSKYSAIYTDREKRVSDLLVKYPLSDATVHDLIKGTIRKIKEDFDQAKTLGTATPPDYAAAIATLEPMAKRVQEAQWRGERGAKYRAKQDEVKGYVAERAKHPDAEEVKLFIQQMRGLILVADIGKTKSFLKSLSMLERADNIDNTLYDAMNRSKEYKAALKTAKQNVKKLKDHDGHAGITKHTSRLDTDLATAETKAGEAKFLHAQKICEAITAEYSKLKKLAIDYKGYLDAKKVLKTVKDSWDKKYIDKISGMTDQVTELESQATTAVADEDYKLAKQHVDAAKALADRAKASAANYAQNHKRSEQTKAGIQTASGDFSGVIGEVEGLRSATDKFDQDNIYTTEISNAADPVQTAKGKIGKKPQDDASIKSDLESAREKLTELLDKVVQRSTYKSIRDGYKSTYDALTNKDRGEAVKPETDAIDKIFEAAKEKADTNKDSFGAVAEIAKLAALLKDIGRKIKDFDAHEKLRKGSIRRRNNWFDAADGVYGTPKTVLDKEFTSYGKKKTAAETDGNNKKWKDALEKLQKAKSDADLYQKMFADYKKAVDEKKKEITDELSPVDTDALVKDQYNAMKPKLEKIDKLIQERQYDQAIALITTAAWDIYSAQDTLTRHTEIKPKLEAAAEAVQKLFEVRSPPVEAAYVRAKHELDKVEAEIKANVYPNAMKLVDAIPDICRDEILIGKDFKTYKPVREAADAAVAALRKDHGADETVGLQLERFDIRLTQLTAIEPKRDFAAIKPVAQAIIDDIAKIRVSATAQAKLKEVSEMLAEAGPSETKDFDKQLAAMRTELAKLETHSGKDCQQVKDHMVRIKRLLDEADQEFNDAGEVPSAREKLSQAAGSVVRVNILALQFVQMDAEVKALLKRFTADKAKYKQPAALKSLFDECNRMIINTQGAVGRGLFETAMNMVKSAEESLAKAAGIGAAHVEYVTKRDEVKPGVDALISHSAHFSVATEVDEARLYFSAAEEMANALKHKEAIDNLKKCAVICTKAEIKADMHANKLPDEGKIKNLLETPNGIKELDEMFKTLDPSVQRKACKKVLEIRFGMELKQTTDKDGNTPDIDPNAAAPNVTRLFSVLAALDDKHTRNNPSMGLVQRFGTEKGTSSFGRSYSFDDKRLTKNIKLRIGRAEMPEETVIGQEWQLGDIDDNCKPVDDTPAQSFSWTTLHEIGHAVDDKFSVMDRNGSSKKYGGWKEYGGEVSEIAEKAEGKFEYSKSYIASYLSNPGGNYPKPEPEGGIDADIWEQRRLEVEAWCDSIRSGKTIWYSATESKRLQIGGRVYQEAYRGKWVSYDYAARAQGVRGYQFRAPGEWFADIYAAFHTGKMNPKHPAREWLEKDMK